MAKVNTVRRWKSWDLNPEALVVTAKAALVEAGSLHSVCAALAAGWAQGR